MANTEHQTKPSNPGSTVNGPTINAIKPGEQIVSILLAEIVADADWNARKKSRVQAVAESGLPEEEENKGIAGLAESIEDRGQDTPVILRPTTDKTLAKTKPYTLVAGFRRFFALHLLAERSANNNVANPIKTDKTWSSKYPTVKAVVRDLSESQARLTNVAENTAREDFSAADLAIGVWDIQQQSAKEGVKLTTEAIAKQLGKNQSYINKLSNIQQKMPAEALKNWREAAKPLPYMEMYKIVTEVPPERYLEAYADLCRGNASGAGTGGTARDPLAWLESAKTAAEERGKFLGRLAALEYVSVDVKEFAWGEGVREFAKFKKTAEPAQVKQIVAACRNGFKAGVKEVAEEAKAAEAEGEDEDE